DAPIGLDRVLDDGRDRVEEEVVLVQLVGDALQLGEDGGGDAARLERTPRARERVGELARLLEVLLELGAEPREIVAILLDPQPPPRLSRALGRALRRRERLLRLGEPRLRALQEPSRLRMVSTLLLDDLVGLRPLRFELLELAAALVEPFDALPEGVGHLPRALELAVHRLDRADRLGGLGGALAEIEPRPILGEPLVLLAELAELIDRARMFTDPRLELGDPRLELAHGLLRRAELARGLPLAGREERVSHRAHLVEDDVARRQRDRGRQGIAEDLVEVALRVRDGLGELLGRALGHPEE